MKIDEIIGQCVYETGSGKIKGITLAAKKIMEIIPANMEVPALEVCAGPLSVERRNLILGRNAGLDEVRKIMGGKR